MITETSDDVRPDPLADTLFGMVTILIFVVVMLLPAMRMASSDASRHEADLTRSLTEFAVLHNGAEPLVVVARPSDAVVVDGIDRRNVGLSQLFDDAGLKQQLQAAREKKREVLLAVAPRGEEVAFLLESVLFRHGPSRAWSSGLTVTVPLPATA